jgi:hypothetical protein
MIDASLEMAAQLKFLNEYIIVRAAAFRYYAFFILLEIKPVTFSSGSRRGFMARLSNCII